MSEVIRETRRLLVLKSIDEIEWAQQNYHKIETNRNSTLVQIQSASNALTEFERNFLSHVRNVKELLRD